MFKNIFSSETQYIHVIADYGPVGDLAFGEVDLALQISDHGHAQLKETRVPAFSTLATGFQIEQIGLRQKKYPRNFAIFSNTAPRGADCANGEEIVWNGNKKQEFVLAELKNGSLVFAVNAAYNLSFVKEDIVRLRRINVTNNGTQFRSRDQYAPATREVLDRTNGWKNLLGEKLDVGSSIQNRPKSRVACGDGYDNLKSSIRFKELHLIASHSGIDLNRDKFVFVTIDGVIKPVLNSFVEDSVPSHGQLFITRGSSGIAGNEYIELIAMRGRKEEGNTAVQQFELKGQRDDQGYIKIEKY